MTIKITTPNGGSDSLDFGCAQTPVVATVTGTEVSSGEGKLELKTTTGGTSATKVTVLANGRVGVGTATADEALQVNGAIKVTGGMATDTASTGAMGYQNSKYRFISWGADTSTKGAFGFEGYSSDGSVNATHLAIDATGDLKFDSGYGSAATAYGCRAWVNFNGTGTVAIRASGNVSSITDNGTGDYSMNFTVAMVDANYSICGSTVGTQSTYYNHIFGSGSSVLTTGSTRFRTANSTNPSQPQDSDFNHVVIFR